MWEVHRRIPSYELHTIQIAESDLTHLLLRYDEVDALIK
jgi:hypothetical protein